MKKLNLLLTLFSILTLLCSNLQAISKLETIGSIVIGGVIGGAIYAQRVERQEELAQEHQQEQGAETETPNLFSQVNFMASIITGSCVGFLIRSIFSNKKNNRNTNAIDEGPLQPGAPVSHLDENGDACVTIELLQD